MGTETRGSGATKSFRRPETDYLSNKSLQQGKILAAASGGGHWIQLHRLSKAFIPHDTVYVTTERHLTDMVTGARCHLIHDVTRKDRFLISVALLQAVTIVLRERPRVVVTTGALPGLLLLLAGKFLVGARTIWIDSIANSRTISGSGRIARNVADTCVSQWPLVAENEGIEFWGSVL